MRLRLINCLVWTLAGCSGLSVTNATGTGGPGGPTASVAIQDAGYAPSVVTIQVGTKVTWTNDGSSTHSVTSDSTGFDSGSLAPPMSTAYGGKTTGEFYQVTFSTPGTYTYHCVFHPTMHGSIMVQ